MPRFGSTWCFCSTFAGGRTRTSRSLCTAWFGMRAACDGSVTGPKMNEGRRAVMESHPRDSGVNFEDFMELCFNAELFDGF